MQFPIGLMAGLVSSCALAAITVAARAQPLDNIFTYQGELRTAGSPASGLHDLRFRLYDAAVGGAQVGLTLCSNNVNMSSGRFTVDLNFGAVFAGQQRFLEIEVRADTGLTCINTAGFVILGPRQPLTAAPNALFALNAATAGAATTAANTAQLNGQGASFYQNAANLSTGTIPSARLSGAYSGPLTLSNAANAFTGAGAGLTGVNADLLDGLNSTAFLQSIPSPLTLSGTSATHIMRGENSSTANGSIAVIGAATAATGETYGVYGSTASTSGRGVLGVSSASTGPADGLYGVSYSTEGRGAVGWATATSGTTYGVYGLTQSPDGYAGYFAGPEGSKNYFERNVGIGTTTPVAKLHVEHLATAGYFVTTGQASGVLGQCTASSGAGTYGGVFQCYSTSGIGVWGQALAGSGVTYGVRGRNDSSDPMAFSVWAEGRLGASGTKSFRIDHPDDPANKYLLHYAAESPEVINFYRGTVALDGAGEAVVELPHYFAKINRDPSYQLTAVGAPMPLLHVVEKISTEALASGAVMEPGEAAPPCNFRIAGGAPGGEVSWRVEAVRNDRYVQKRGAPVEVEKQGPEKGTYQHPELYGQPPEKGMNYDATRQRPDPALPEPIAAAPR